MARMHIVEVWESNSTVSSLLQNEVDLLQDHRERICPKDYHAYHCKSLSLLHSERIKCWHQHTFHHNWEPACYLVFKDLAKISLVNLLLHLHQSIEIRLSDRPPQFTLSPPLAQLQLDSLAISTRTQQRIMTTSPLLALQISLQ